jgi:hypothetical protein
MRRRDGARRRSRDAEINPIDDFRSTAGFRRAVAARVVARLFRDEGGWYRRVTRASLGVAPRSAVGPGDDPIHDRQ